MGKGIVLRDVETKEETTVVDLSRFSSLDQSRSMVRQIADPKLNEISYNLRNLIIDFAQELLEPNITLNTNATAERRKMAVNEVNPVLYQIKAGEMIVREGERVGPEQLLKLSALQSESRVKGAFGQRYGCRLHHFRFFSFADDLTLFQTNPART